MTKRTRVKDYCFSNLPGADLHKSPLFKIWSGMIDRCYVRKGRGYYGRVKVCKRWLDSFNAFREDMGDKPTGKHTLDRIDSSGDYTPENCRWATPLQQIRNRSNTLWVEHKGQKKTLKEWSIIYGIPYKVIRNRIRTGGRSFEEAINIPYQKSISNVKRVPSFAKITREDAVKIRELYQDGKRKAELARMYGVTLQNICKIIAKETWV